MGYFRAVEQKKRNKRIYNQTKNSCCAGVYYDDKNNLTHYMKDGKEDFLMLFLKNGKSAELYKNKFFLGKT